MGRWRVAIVAAAGLVLVGLTLIDPLVVQADDSWFYLVIGRNIADGHGITFNTVLPTNGFQPLWQALVAGVAWAGSLVGINTPLAEARLVIMFGAALLAAGLWRLAVLMGRLAVPGNAVVLALLVPLLFLGGALGTVGSEANLVFLLVVVAVSATLQAIESPDRILASAMAGFWLGLMVLGRLDTGFVALAALGAMALAGRAQLWTRLRSALAAGLVASAVVGPYLVWNQVRFGHLMPIAGAIKMDQSRLWLRPESIGPYGWALLSLALVGGLAAFVGRRPPRLELAAWAIPMVGGLASTAVYLAWSPGRLTDLSWYRMPQLMAAAVAAGLVARRVASRSPRLADVAVFAAAAVTVPALIVSIWAFRVKGANQRFWTPVAAFSQEVGAVVPDGGVIATLDYAGVMAAYSGRPVVALDGLTGDFQFQDDLRDIGAGCTLGGLGVGWLVVDDSERLLLNGPTIADGARVEISSWLRRAPAGYLSVAADDLALVDEATGLSLWKVSPHCEA